MLFLVRLGLIKLHCADGCLVREELTQFVEGNDLLIFLEVFPFKFFFLCDIL